MEREPQIRPEHLPGHEELEQLRSKEASVESTERGEKAKHEQLERAREVIEQQPERPAPERPEREEAPKPHPTRLDKMASYRDTMRSMQRKLPAASRAFSRFIHQPVVEQISEVTAKTVARPSVSLGATLTAAIVGGVSYITAKRVGFALEGSVFLFSLLAGAILGLLIEFIVKLVTSLKHR